MTISSNALAEMFKQETGEAILFLVEIDHADWGSPLRIVNNMKDIVSAGNTYTAFPFSIDLPRDIAEKEQKTTIKVCNVDRQIISLLRALSSSPTVTVSTVLGSTPDTIEVGPFIFTLTDASYDLQTITATLAYEDVLSEPIPKDTFNPADYAGLF